MSWYFSGYWLTEWKALPQHCGLVLQQLLAEAAEGTPPAGVCLQITMNSECWITGIKLSQYIQGEFWLTVVNLT